MADDDREIKLPDGTIPIGINVHFTRKQEVIRYEDVSAYGTIVGYQINREGVFYYTIRYDHIYNGVCHPQQTMAVHPKDIKEVK